MNKYLRQLFTAVIALFVVLGMSTTIITAIRANSLSSDPRNARALYQEYGAPRGAILASDGTILAQSTPVNDVFSYQRSYTNGPVYAPVTGFFSGHPARRPRHRIIPQQAAERQGGRAVLGSAEIAVHRRREQGRVHRDVHQSQAAAARLPATRQQRRRRSGHRGQAAAAS